MYWELDFETRYLQRRLKESFWLFVKYGFGVARNPRGKWLTERVHKPICDLLQREGLDWLAQRARKEQGRRKIMCMIPRGFGKTVVITKAFSVWIALHDPDLACVIDSEGAQKSREFLAPVKTMLEGGDPYSLFTALYGVWFDPDRLWRDHQFTHAMRRQMALTEPSFDTASVETGITGTHPDLHIGDDYVSQEKLREKGNWIQVALQHTDAIFPALRNDSMVIFPGTPYTKADVLMTHLEQDGIKEVHGMKLPAAFPEPTPNGEWILYYLQARDNEGKSVLPEAWPDKELDRYERKKPMDFAAQMMCNPGTGAHMPITAEQVEELWIDRVDVPTNLVISVHMDTAFKEMKRKASGDESVIQFWGHDLRNRGDVYYLEGYGSNAWSHEDFTTKLVGVIQRYQRQLRRVRAITDEVGIGGKFGLWEKSLQNAFAAAGVKMPRLILIQRAGTRKVIRMTEALGYWTDGRVRLVRNSPGSDKLVRQVLEVGVGAHDDWPDAMADVFHPEIYQAQLNDDLSDGVNAPRRPYDEYLHSGKITDEGAVEAYDLTVEEEDPFPWANTARS